MRYFSSNSEMCAQKALFSEKSNIYLFNLAVLIEVLSLIGRFKILQSSEIKQLKEGVK